MVWNLEIANKCTLIFDGHSRFPPICISWSLGVAFGSFVILDELFDDPSPFWWPASSFPQRRFGAWTGGNSSGASSPCQSSQPRQRKYSADQTVTWNGGDLLVG